VAGRGELGRRTQARDAGKRDVIGGGWESLKCRLLALLRLRRVITRQKRKRKKKKRGFARDCGVKELKFGMRFGEVHSV
jgi:hypothetical protein